MIRRLFVQVEPIYTHTQPHTRVAYLIEFIFSLNQRFFQFSFFVFPRRNKSSYNNEISREKTHNKSRFFLFIKSVVAISLVVEIIQFWAAFLKRDLIIIIIKLQTSSIFLLLFSFLNWSLNRFLSCNKKKNTSIFTHTLETTKCLES